MTGREHKVGTAALQSGRWHFLRPRCGYTMGGWSEGRARRFEICGPGGGSQPLARGMLMMSDPDSMPASRMVHRTQFGRLRVRRVVVSFRYEARLRSDAQLPKKVSARETFETPSASQKQVKQGSERSNSCGRDMGMMDVGASGIDGVRLSGSPERASGRTACCQHTTQGTLRQIGTGDCAEVVADGRSCWMATRGAWRESETTWAGDRAAGVRGSTASVARCE